MLGSYHSCCFYPAFPLAPGAAGVTFCSGSSSCHEPGRHWEVHIPSGKGTAREREGSWAFPNRGPPVGTQKAHSESQLGDNALIQRFPDPAPSLCVRCVLYRITLMLTSHRNCAPTAVTHPHITEGPGIPGGGSEKEKCPHPWDQKPPAPSLQPQEKLEQSAPSPASPSEEGLWGQGVFYTPAFAWRRFPSCYRWLGSGACCQPGALLPAPTPAAAEPSSLSCTSRAPHPCPQAGMLHPWGHSWGELCQMCKPTPLPFPLLRGCGLAAAGRGTEGGGGEGDQGQGRSLPL